MGRKPPNGEKDKPSLELPSLRLSGRGRKKAGGRRRKGSQPEAEPPVDEPLGEGSVDQESTPVPAAEEAVTTAPEGQPRRNGVAGSRADRSKTSPVVPVLVATVITGLLVGGSGAGLTYLGLVGCESLRGTSTCGGPGLFLLVAILVLMILFGMLLLKAWRVSDPGGTSFLAVGVVAVAALLASDEIFSVWMFLFVPLVSAASYVLAHWVTTRFVDDTREGPPRFDVR